MAQPGRYIRLHKTLVDWRLYQDVNAKCLFIHLLLCAAHRECYIYGRKIERGQYLASFRRLSADLGVSTATVKRSLDKLVENGEVTAISNARGTLVTIVNYEKFQADVEPKKKKPERSGFEQ